MSLRWKCDWCGAETFPNDKDWSELTFEGNTHHYCEMCKNVVRTHILHPDKNVGKLMELYECYDELYHAVGRELDSPFPNLARVYKDAVTKRRIVSEKLQGMWR